MARAQYADNDRQNPTEYTDEDSHPLRLVAYILSPIGFVLEWCVARPLHYLATDTFLAPVLNGDTKEPEYRPPAIAEIPLDNVGDEPPSPSRFPSDIPAQKKEDVRQPGTGAGAGGGSGSSQPVIQ